MSDTQGENPQSAPSREATPEASRSVLRRLERSAGIAATCGAPSPPEPKQATVFCQQEPNHAPPHRAHGRAWAVGRRATQALRDLALGVLPPFEDHRQRCTGASDCAQSLHVHGCYADDGFCDDPEDHTPPGRLRAADDEPVYGALARAEALAAGDRDWMNCTRWPRDAGREATACTCPGCMGGPVPQDCPPTCADCISGQHGRWRRHEAGREPTRDDLLALVRLLLRDRGVRQNLQDLAERRSEWAWVGTLLPQRDVTSPTRNPTVDTTCEQARPADD